MDKQTDNPYLLLSETISPADAADVADAVRRTAETSTPVYPLGGATRLGYGAPLNRPGLGLSLNKLNRLVDHASRDLTVTVEAGMTIARLQKTLAAANQRLPVDIAWPDRATIGGAVAIDASGPRSYRWGSIRDYALGLRAVDGQGTEFDAGGRVVKNAAGYNVCRLLTGSLGTLGVITQVTLMVRPVAETEGWIVCGVTDYASAERLLADLVQTETLPVAIEWLMGSMWDCEPTLSKISSGSAGRLLVGFEGDKTEVEWMLDTVTAQWKQQGVDSTVVIADSQAKSLTQQLTDAASADTVTWPASLAVRISVLPSALVRTVEQIVELVDENMIQARAGTGTLVARFLVDPEGTADLVTNRLRPLVAQAGGTMVVLNAPPEVVLDRAAIWGPEPAGFSTMQAIKREFDPYNILNPGRFVFE